MRALLFVINVSNSISKYLFEGMVDFPETMDWALSWVHQSIHIVTGNSKTKAGKISSFSISKYDIPLTLLRKVLKRTHYHITLPKQLFFDINFLLTGAYSQHSIYLLSHSTYATSSPTSKFVTRNHGFAQWQIDYSQKFILLIKSPSLSSWCRGIWYGCHLSSF